jgi:hypothetical protein
MTTQQFSLDPKAVRRAAFILGAVIVLQGATILAFHTAFIDPIFQHVNRVGAIGWISATVAALAYIAYSVRGLHLQPYMRNVSAFRLLGPLMAIPSSILEEIFFRQYAMNVLARWGQGVAVQVVVSALVFGVLHAAWGFRGGIRALLGALVATTLLGAMLAIVYLASNRVVFPCIAAHFAINFVLEPWLVYAYVVLALRRRA